MASTRQIIDKLNDIRATEQRQELVYRQLSALATGPYRTALSEEFSEHAETEAEHADIAMRHLMALDGDLTPEVKNIPVWRDLNQALTELVKLEEDGIRSWQELMNMLPSTDAFRHVIEGVLEREVEHWEDAKRWLRTDYAEKSLMKTPGDIGSIVPLNLRQRPAPFVDVVQKAETHNERLWSSARHGTPPMRQGMFNGAMPATNPAFTAEANPPLYIGKAVTDPAMAGSGAQDATPRKRDPSTGQFTESPTAGPETTAEDDASDAARSAKLAQRRYGTAKALGDAMGGGPMLAQPKQNPMQQAGIPAVPPGAPSAAQPGMSGNAQAGMGTPMATLQDGTPMYSDPYHPAHSGFTPEQHVSAADMHNQQSEMMTNSGQIPSALDHQLKARIHSDLANDSKSPMDRALNRPGMPWESDPKDKLNDFMGMIPGAGGAPAPAPAGAAGAAGAPAGGNNDAMDNFMTQLPDKNPGAQNQNKPLMPSPTDAQGPLPRMTNTNTNSPVGPQSQSAQFAGTTAQPQQTPPDPSDGSSMPEIAGQGMPEPDMDLDHFSHADSPYASVQGSDPSAQFEAAGGSQNTPDTDDAAGDEFGFSSLAGDGGAETPKDASPTPGSTESEPPAEGAGPSVEDKGAVDKEPFKKDNDAMKSLFQMM